MSEVTEEQTYFWPQEAEVHQQVTPAGNTSR